MPEERQQGGNVRAALAADLRDQRAQLLTRKIVNESVARLGARYLAAVAGRIVRDVGTLLRRVPEPATFALDAEVGLRSPAARVAFVDDLAAAVTAVIQRHHVDGGRTHRLVVAAHPIPDSQEEPSI